MKTNFYITLIFSALIFFSCSNDENDKVIDSPIQNNCESGMGRMLYTECCVEGPIKAKPNEIISVTYTSNFESSIYSWEVLGGSMTLVEGENSQTAKFRTANNFVSDSIMGNSISPNGVPECSSIIVITSY